MDAVPPKRLSGRVAIVTGSSSGIGRSIAMTFAREGAHVLCADLRPQATLQREKDEGETHELIEQRGGSAAFLKTDVGDPDNMKALVDEAVRLFGGRLDIMVNNAGVAIEGAKPALCHETDLEVWDTTMRVNGRSVFLGCKYALTQMVKQDPSLAGNRGKIINLSSIYGLVAGGMNPSYCMSKGGIVNMTRQLAFDYAPFKINCNAICPGHVDTAIWEATKADPERETSLRGQYPWGDLGQPQDIANAALFLASDESRWLTGVSFPVDGGYTCK